MKRAFKLVLLPLLLNASPTALVTGAVRDQFGQPVDDARVVAGSSRTVTQADGTFALQTTARAVHIECSYCRPADARVDNDGTVAAIVVRYGALRTRGPSQQDIAALPYARAESLISLRPYAVLFSSSRALAGSQVALYGSLRGNYGLLIDNGVPSYDSAANSSPYRTIPGFDASSIDVRDIQDAPRYGDLARNGTFYVSSEERSGALAFSATQRAVRLTQQSPFSFGTAAVFSDASESTSRIDVGVHRQYERYNLTANAFTAADSTANNVSSLDSFISAAHARVRMDTPLHPYVDIVADRAGYTSGPALAASWSDVALETGVQTGGAISYFADAAGRVSTQWYARSPQSGLRAGGTAWQTHVDAGAGADAGNLQWQAMVAGIDLSDSVHTYPYGSAQHTLAMTPSFDVRYAFASHWNVEATAVNTIQVPYLTEREVAVDTFGNAFPRESQERVSFGYTDLSRVSFELSAVRQFSASPSTQLTSVGAYAAWQISPAVSLRAWSLRMDAPYDRTPISTWIAYRAPSGITADLIWRRDLLDLSNSEHIDASLGVPIARGLQFFAGTEQRAGARFASIGVRALAQ